MDRRRAAGALLALAACIACSTAAPTASNQTALELLDGPSEGCYYNFQHYGEGDRIMTNEPCLNCTCHNRMLMCYLKVCPFTKPIGQDCTIEKRADQCCPIVTCPDVPVDLLTSTSTSSPAEYGANGLGKVDKYGCSINGKYFSEGSKVPPTPNKPCEHCYCIRNMTTCVMQECTLHVDGCTPIYHKDVCCPVRYSCDHEDEMLLLDDMTTTVRPTPGFLLTTTTMPSVTQISQNCVHDDQVFADGALIKTEIACEHCYCMKGDIVCVVQECGTPMENEGKNCTSLPPRQGQCCPDTYICEGDELSTDSTTGVAYEELTTLSPPRRVEGSGYRNEPDEPYTEIPAFEGSGEEHATTSDTSDIFTTQKQTPQIIDEILVATEESLKPTLTTTEPDKEQNTVPDDANEDISNSQLSAMTTIAQEVTTTVQPTDVESIKDTSRTESKTTISDYPSSSGLDNYTSKDDEFMMTTESAEHYTKDESDKDTEKKPGIETDDEFMMTTESAAHYTKDESDKDTEKKPGIETEITESFDILKEVTTPQTYTEPSSSDASTEYKQEDITTTSGISIIDEIYQPKVTTTEASKDYTEIDLVNKDEQDISLTRDKEDTGSEFTTTAAKIDLSETTSINPIENEIDEDALPPGRIPGEGDCLLNGVTYKNNTNVPNINNCHSSCKCLSSIVKCDPIICSPPPEQMDNMNDCQPIYDTPDACCPTYVCHSRETIPPESHSQMSGTESPKPSIETECHGENCQSQETKPITHELCNSGNCEPETIVQEKECKNGVCEDAEKTTNVPPPLENPEGCTGDTCLTSVENCIDGKCQPTPTETICNSESGCQPSETCEGNNCVIRPEIPETPKEGSLCKNSEECEVSDTSSCDGSKCDTSNKDTQVSDESNVPPECTEESCRRKEQPQENQSPIECSGSNCVTQEVKDESISLTTDSSIKDEGFKDSTTEIIDGNEIQKVSHFETTTETEDTSFEQSTDKSKGTSVEDLSEVVTEKKDYNIGSSESYETKLEKTTTEIYNEPETEKYETITDSYGTKPKDIITESVEHITKETPLATQYEEHPTNLPKEEESSIPITAYETSTKTLEIVQDHEIKEADVTEISDEFTQTQESSTKPTGIITTTSKLLETVVTEQDYTKAPDILPETPEEHSTYLEESTKVVTQDGVITESQPDVSMTESSVTLLLEAATDKDVNIKIQDEDVIIPGQITTEPDIQLQQSTEQNEAKLQEPTTNKIYNETENDHITTENPSMFTKEIPKETSAPELHKIGEDSKYPQTTEIEIPSMDTDTDRKTTESFIKDQENLSQTTTTYDTEKYTISDETPEHVTSVSSLVHATQPFTTDEVLVTHMQEIPTSQKDESDLADSMKEIITQQPDVPVTNIHELTSENINVHDTTSGTVSGNLDEHTGTPIKDLIELSTTMPKEIIPEDITTKESTIIETQENEITTKTIPVIELEITPEPMPSTGLDTTITSVLSDKDQQVTKYVDTEPGIEPSKESTDLPDILPTKSDESTSVSSEIEKISETSTISRVENEQPTTESLEQPYEDKSQTSDYLPTISESQEPSIEESTSTPMTSQTKTHDGSEDTIIPVPTDENKIEEKPLDTTPETINEISVGQNTKQIDDVTESAVNDMKETDLSVSKETEATQPEETATKSTELQTDQETSIAPTHVTKEEKESTESPMSLVTKTLETTEPNEPVEEEVKTPEHLPEHTTTNDLDYHDKEKTPSVTENAYLDITTKAADKLAPTIENQEVTTQTQYPIKTDSEITTVVIHEPTSVPLVTMISEESYATENQEPSTRSPEISSSATNVVDDHEPDTKPEDASTKESNLEDATEPQSYLDLTTPDSKTSEILTENQEGTQKETDITVELPKTEHTIAPEIFTTKYYDSFDENQEKQTEEPKPSKQEEHTLDTELYGTTEKMIYTEQTFSPDIESQSSMSQNQDKSTDSPQSSIEKESTTAVYQDLATRKEETFTNVPELDMTTTNILTTEGSDILPSEENNRRTLSPSLEIIPPEQLTTELPEIIKTPEVEQTGTTQDVSLNIPEKESVTLVPISDEFEKVTSIPLATEGDSKFSAEPQDFTLKPDTGLYVTEQNEITAETTVRDDLTNKPVDATSTKEPSEDTVPQMSQTETSIPKETDVSELKGTEAPGILTTQSDISVPVETEIFIPETTESSIINKIEDTIVKETESTVPKETEASLPEVTVASVTVSSEPENTEVSDYVSKEPIPEVTASSIPEENEASVPEKSDVSAEKVTEAAIPEVTEDAQPGITEISVSEVTGAPGAEITVAPGAEITEVSGPETTKTSVPEIVETTVSVSDTSVPIEKESGDMNKEPEGTTYKPIDEIPVEQASTLEPMLSSSETTPYLVELQEHTTKPDEDILSMTPAEEDRTKAPETSQTERGDQPLDSLLDKSTQEDEEHTKETITKQDDQLTTLLPEQAGEFVEKTTDKAELSPEPAIPTDSDAQIEKHTTTSAEQGTTTSPSVSETFTEHEKFTTAAFETETTTHKKDLPLDTEKIGDEIPGSETLIPSITKATTIKMPEESSTHLPITDDKFTKPEDKPSESYPPTTVAELPKPGINEILPTEEIPSPDFSPNGSSGYGQEPDYVEEDQPFGPGTCRYGGKVYVSAQQIPRDDPCDFCFCFRSDIICLQQSCPPPIHGCHEEPIQGFCCPRYECPVSMATTLNVTTTTTTTTTTLPPHFLPHAYKGAAQRRGCQIKGHSYKVGEVVRASSGPCLHCTCGGDGQMKCDPKACTPEPMLRQMIAAAVSAKRRR